MTAHQTDADLSGRKILVGVTGGIAAYKAIELVRLFKKAGADVQVLMTPDAERFVTPLTLGTVSEHEVLIDLFPEREEGSWTKHITLGRWADLFVIAPATAQTLAKLAHGFSDNMLTATVLAARCPILLCPAMDHDMLVHPATVRNLDTLRSDGHAIMPPAHGPLASGLVGEGRLPEPREIFEEVSAMLETIAPASDEVPGGGSEASASDEVLGGAVEAPASTAKPHRYEVASAVSARSHGEASAIADLAGKHVVVTAGPTREHLDPVRFITNPSSGKMGFALADAAARRGASVTLISGPTQLDPPAGVSLIHVTTAREMYDAVMDRRRADVVIMAAAVSDYTPHVRSDQKIKKSEGEMVVRLERTRDILAELGRKKRDGQVLIGFAMETENWLENARRKLESKNADWIVLNRLNEEGAGFESDTNRVILLGTDGTETELPLMSKSRIADEILKHVFRDVPVQTS